MSDIPTRRMTPRQAKFVELYLRTSNGKQSAIGAGYADASAKQTAWELVHENPATMAAIQKVRDESSEKAKWNYEKAMAEADEIIKFARETENANAMIRASEHKSKLAGLVDKSDPTMGSRVLIQINGVDEIKSVDVFPVAIEGVESPEDETEGE